MKTHGPVRMRVAAQLARARTDCHVTRRTSSSSGSGRSQSQRGTG